MKTAMLVLTAVVLVALAFLGPLGCGTKTHNVFEIDLNMYEATYSLNQLFAEQARCLGTVAPAGYGVRVYIAPTMGHDVTTIYGERGSTHATAEYVANSREPAGDPLADAVTFQPLDDATADAAETVCFGDQFVGIRLSLAQPRNFRVWGNGWYVEVISQPPGQGGYVLSVNAVGRENEERAKAVARILAEPPKGLNVGTGLAQC